MEMPEESEPERRNYSLKFKEKAQNMHIQNVQ